jgi:hypothetical protein
MPPYRPRLSPEGGDVIRYVLIRENPTGCYLAKYWLQALAVRFVCWTRGVKVTMHRTQMMESFDEWHTHLNRKDG